MLIILFPVDIEAQILEIQGMKATLLAEGEQGVGLDSTGFFDQEIYGGSDSRFAGYVTSIAANEQEDVRIYRPVVEGSIQMVCSISTKVQRLHLLKCTWLSCISTTAQGVDIISLERFHVNLRFF